MAGCASSSREVSTGEAARVRVPPGGLWRVRGYVCLGRARGSRLPLLLPFRRGPFWKGKPSWRPGAPLDPYPQEVSPFPGDRLTDTPQRYALDLLPASSASRGGARKSYILRLQRRAWLISPEQRVCRGILAQSGLAASHSGTNEARACINYRVVEGGSGVSGGGSRRDSSRQSR